MQLLLGREAGMGKIDRLQAIGCIDRKSYTVGGHSGWMVPVSAKDA